LSGDHSHSLHSIRGDPVSFVWDNSISPAIEVESGEVIELEAADASGGQLGPDSTPADVPGLDFDRVNPITGPVFVRGAKPGDVLSVEILELRPRDWGWTAIIPGFGLLAEEFSEPWLRISEVSEDDRRVRFADGVSLPLAPFPGTIGVAPAEAGSHSVIPPRRWGGNMDIKHLQPGSTLHLPVGVEGALFSLGDTHAAMGDGEVCGSAVETAMDVVVRLTVRRDFTTHYPHYEIPAGQLARGEQSGYYVCIGIHEDLLEATREATRAVIDHLVNRRGRERQEAYAIASVAVDLRVHEVVDIPNWVVGAFLPEAIFD
jgi:acetamidase/formamidase